MGRVLISQGFLKYSANVKLRVLKESDSLAGGTEDDKQNITQSEILAA